MKSYLIQFFQSLLRRRALVLGLTLVWCLLCLWQGRQVKPDFSIEQFFPVHSKQRQIFEAYHRDFPFEDNQVVIFWQEPKLTPASIAAMTHLAKSMRTEGLENVQWFGNTEHLRFLELPLMTVPQLTPLLPAVLPAHISDSLRIWREDALYQKRLWNSDQTTFVISAFVPKDLNNGEGRGKIEQALQEQIALYQGPAKLVLSGIPMIRAQYLRYLNQEQAVFLGGGILLALGVMFLFFRNLPQTLLCLSAIVPAYLSILALMGLMGRSLSVLSSTLPLIFLLVGLSDTIHLLVHFRKSAEDLSRREAIVLTFQKFALPCFYTSLTTAIGFLSLISTGIEIIVDFAVFAAIGIFLVYIFAMLLFPILLSFFKSDGFNQRGLNAHWMTVSVSRVGSLAQKYAGIWLLTSLIVIACSAYWAGQIPVNVFLVDGVRSDHPLAQDLDWIDQQGFGQFQLALYLEDPTKDFSDRDLLDWSEAYEQTFLKHPLVTGSLSLNQRMQGLAQRFTQPPELVQLRQEIGKYPSLTRDVWNPVSHSAQISLIVRDQGSQKMQELVEAIQAYLKSHPPPLQSAHLTGTVQMAQESFDRTLNGFASSMLWAVGLIFICMLFLLRSVRYSILAMLPNLVPMFGLLASLYFFDYPLEPSTVLVFSIAYGLAVDNTIHLLSLFQSYREQGNAPKQALDLALASGGRAMLITAIVLGSGFSGLMLTSFKPLFLLGFLITLSLVYAIIGDLLILPAGISWLNKSKKVLK